MIRSRHCPCSLCSTCGLLSRRTAASSTESLRVSSSHRAARRRDRRRASRRTPTRTDTRLPGCPRFAGFACSASWNARTGAGVAAVRLVHARLHGAVKFVAAAGADVTGDVERDARLALASRRDARASRWITGQVQRAILMQGARCAIADETRAHVGVRFAVPARAAAMPDALVTVFVHARAGVDDADVGAFLVPVAELTGRARRLAGSRVQRPVTHSVNSLQLSPSSRSRSVQWPSMQVPMAHSPSRRHSAPSGRRSTHSPPGSGGKGGGKVLHGVSPGQSARPAQGVSGGHANARLSNERCGSTHASKLRGMFTIAAAIVRSSAAPRQSIGSAV